MTSEPSCDSAPKARCDEVEASDSGCNKTGKSNGGDVNEHERMMEKKAAEILVSLSHFDGHERVSRAWKKDNRSMDTYLLAIL